LISTVGLVLIGPMLWLLATSDQLVDGRRVRVFGIARKRDLALQSLYTQSSCLAYASTSDVISIETDDGQLDVAETKRFSLAGVNHSGTTDGKLGANTLEHLHLSDNASATTSCAMALT
jgi:hypothetical protein